jgi:hypothetical protein
MMAYLIAWRLGYGSGPPGSLYDPAASRQRD